MAFDYKKEYKEFYMPKNKTIFFLSHFPYRVAHILLVPLSKNSLTAYRH